MYENIDVNKLFDTESKYGQEFNLGCITEEMIKNVEKKLG